MNLRLSIKTLIFEIFPLKQHIILSFQIIHMVARKEDIRSCFPFDPITNFNASNRLVRILGNAHLQLYQLITDLQSLSYFAIYKKMIHYFLVCQAYGVRIYNDRLVATKVIHGQNL